MVISVYPEMPEQTGFQCGHFQMSGCGNKYSMTMTGRAKHSILPR